MDRFRERAAQQRELDALGKDRAGPASAGAPPQQRGWARWTCPVIYVTPQERDALYAARKESMSDYASRVSLSGRLPFPAGFPFGVLQLARRDRDGSLVAAVRGKAGTRAARYVRRLRVGPLGPWAARSVPLARVSP